MLSANSSLFLYTVIKSRVRRTSQLCINYNAPRHQHLWCFIALSIVCVLVKRCYFSRCERFCLGCGSFLAVIMLSRSMVEDYSVFSVSHFVCLRRTLNLVRRGLPNRVYVLWSGDTSTHKLCTQARRQGGFGRTAQATQRSA